jgi:hypothetical protein
MAGIPKVRVQFDADFDELKKGVRGATNEVESFGSKVGDFSKKAGKAFALVGAAAGIMAIKIGVDSIKAASDLGETISKVGVLFGDSAKEIEKFADGAAQSLGQTKQQALDAAANFAIFGSSAGLAGEDLVKFSTDFVSLAGDLASFNNVSQDEAINAIGSALRGEAEPLRKFGVLLDAATLEAAAFELGIYDGSGALTAQQKILAAQEVIFQQTTTAQGDFTRTSEGLANQSKILTAELENTKLIIGEALLPIVLELATAFSKKIVPRIKDFAQGLAGKEGLNEGLEKSNSAAFEWGERINKVIKFVVGFKDEIIILIATLATLFTISAISGWVLATVAGIKTLITAYNALKASAIVAGIASQFALNPLLGVGAVAAAAVVLSAGVALSNKYNTKLPGGLEESMSGANNRIREQLNNGSSISPIVANAGAGGSTITQGGISGGGISAISAAQSKVNDLQKGVNKQLAKTKDALAVANSALQATKPFDPNYQDAFARPGGSSINITVNGAIDKEGTARQIVEILNDSYYRGTLGAGALVS